LYAGAVYDLYEYKKYTDVRLVFAPEFDTAFFGGDPDNFNYPRYDLDIALFRVYENDKPAHLDSYLHWSKAGVKEDDLIFVSGNPGSTDRLETVSQLEFLRDVRYPSLLALFTRRIALLQNFSAISAENARIAQEEIFGYQNGYKAINGSESGLKNEELMAAKAVDEKKLRAAAASNPKLNAEVGDPWSAIARAMVVEKQNYLSLVYLEREYAFNSDLAGIARTLVRVTQEKTKPDGERLREYADSGLASLEQQLFSAAPIYKSLEIVTLTDSLAAMQQEMGETNPIVQKMLGGKSAAEVAKNLIDSTKLDDVAVRKQLYSAAWRQSRHLPTLSSSCFAASTPTPARFAKSTMTKSKPLSARQAPKSHKRAFSTPDSTTLPTPHLPCVSPTEPFAATPKTLGRSHISLLSPASTSTRLITATSRLTGYPNAG
jgi:hypothetical protein